MVKKVTKKMSKGMATRGSGRARSADREQGEVRQKMINALSMNSFKGGDGAVGSKPATYGNYPGTKNPRNKARNAAYGSGTRTRGGGR